MTAYVMRGGVNVAQPEHAPAAGFGVFADFYGKGPVHWGGMSFPTASEANRVAARLTMPYEVLPL